ncbi:TetR/AcrR family transcriptional regulator [Paenibacillus arenilitoris]|uniref:TetR/AcrR family transcriptional regulator n=1 Tax=Paenibacillus arenilitoris TaxID=2772299 RepID=A0A927CGY0_9BACL|nr:TetR/AcrR family transcriptional regulator [Paenibacillus arenilitoris]MBD2867345.1 TetR/AcrR family transcriptional regulator [Paenibacillus arenilitoris]
MRTILREIKKKNTKEEIVRQAVALFKQKGYDQVTVEEIAHNSGIAKGTFFNYFPKKEHILLHLAESHSQLMGQIVARHNEGAPKERIYRVLRDLLDIYLKYSGLLRLTLVETIKSAAESREAPSNMAVLQEAVRDLIEEAKHGGSLRSRWDSDAAASVLAGVFFHTLITHASDAREEAILESLRLQLDVVWEGIADE